MMEGETVLCLGRLPRRHSRYWEKLHSMEISSYNRRVHYSEKSED